MWYVQQVFLDKCYLTSHKWRIRILTSSIIPSPSILNIVFEGFLVGSRTELNLLQLSFSHLFPQTSLKY